MDSMKKTYFKWMFERGTNTDQETNSGKDILFREHGKTSGERGLEERASNLI